MIRHGAVEPAFLEIFQDGFINSAAVESDGKERFSVYNRPAVFIDIAGIPAGFPLFHEQMKRLFRKNRFIFQVQEFYIDFHFSVGQIAEPAAIDLIPAFPESAFAVDRNPGGEIGVGNPFQEHFALQRNFAFGIADGQVGRADVIDGCRQCAYGFNIQIVPPDFPGGVFAQVKADDRLIEFRGRLELQDNFRPLVFLNLFIKITSSHMFSLFGKFDTEKA